MEDDGLDRVALAERVYVVVVVILARRAQHHEVAAATAGAHAHVVLVDVVTAAL